MVAVGRPRPDRSNEAAIHVERGDDIVAVNLVVDEPAPPRARRGEIASTSEVGIGRGALHGRVLREGGGPLALARVWLRRHGMGLREATTDVDGRFLMNGLPPGRFALQGSYPGYVTLEYGQTRATQAGRAIEIRSDETVRGVDLILPRGGAISGSVADEHGDPVEGAIVAALQVRFVVGRPVARRTPGVRERRSDDQGRYRLFGLLPGTYLVSASVDAPVSRAAPAKSRGYAPSFYPGRSDVREAWQLALDVHRDAFGVHIVLAPSPAVRVSGTVVESKGRPLNGTVLLSISQRSGGIALEPRTAHSLGEPSPSLPCRPPTTSSRCLERARPASPASSSRST